MSALDREAPRVDISLDVFLQTVDGDVPCKTRDASYEGVFIVRRDPLPLRKLIRFRTRLPDSGEELQMLGLVAHTVNATDAAEMGRDPGMGIQLFSLGLETRDVWREFIDHKYQEDPEARRTIEESRLPNVQVRIPNLAILRRLRTVDLPKGELFVRTPELHPEGTAVACVVSHPTRDEEFVLSADVVERVEGTVKERGLRLSINFPDDLTDLEAFVDGEIPEPSAEAPAPPESLPPTPGEDAEGELGDEVSYDYEISDEDMFSEVEEVEPSEAEEEPAEEVEELTEEKEEAVDADDEQSEEEEEPADEEEEVPAEEEEEEEVPAEEEEEEVPAEEQPKVEIDEELSDEEEDHQ